jgi:hypothetical protein
MHAVNSGTAPALRGRASLADWLRRRLRGPWAWPGAFLALLSIAWLVQLVAQGTYPSHIDEGHLSRHALHMLFSGDPSPHWFRYGSLPIYLTAAGMQLGVWIGRAQGALVAINEVWSVAAPYYSHWVVMFVPKLLFLLIGLCGVASAGALGAALSPDPLARLLPMMVLGCAPLYAYHSVAYLNVDVLASALVLAALALLAHSASSPRFSLRVAWPAVLCGATIATKYNSGLIALPFALGLLLERRYTWLLALGLLTPLAFFAFAPFCALEPARWLEDMQFELHHYRTGHPGYEDDPGLPQLAFYLLVLRDNFGWPLCACALLGARASLRAAPRGARLTLLFPIALLLFMASNRVHFARSVLPAIATLAVFMALGVVWCMREGPAWLLRWFRARRAAESASLRDRPWRAALALGIGAALIGPILFMAVARAVAPVHDSRVRIARFIARRAHLPCQVIVPVQMRIDPKHLAGSCEVVVVNLRGHADVQALLQAPQGSARVQRFVVHAPFIEDGLLSRRRGAAWRELIAAANPPDPILVAGTQPVQLWQRTRDMPDPHLSVYSLR